MTSLARSSIRLFRFAGVDVYLHWSWLLVAAFEISRRRKAYTSPIWAVWEYFALFFIVLLHEYGHALACRQVGGKADKIVLWPFGGAAYIAPPMRPGATLWSVAAGPLVNVVLLFALSMVVAFSRSMGWGVTMPNAGALVQTIWSINLVLLVFNLLPIYPLDGGQILRSLLWFVAGRARSLMLVAGSGFIGVAGFMAIAWWKRSLWFAALAVVLLIHCWRGLKQARSLWKLSILPRHGGFACPCCKAEPPKGKFWRCGQCNFAFDTFQAQAVCPRCAARFDLTQCMDCGKWQSMTDWVVAAGVTLNGSRAESSPLEAHRRSTPIHDLLAQWRHKLGGHSTNTPLRLLGLLAANPFVTITGAANQLNPAFTTAQRGIERLERNGIVQPASDAERDRVDSAQPLLDILEEPAHLKPLNTENA